MSVSPRDLLREARRLEDTADDEAGRRSAIRQAYYAAFHGAEEFHKGLAASGERPGKRKGVHETLIHQLRNPALTLPDAIRFRSKVIGELLLRLRPFRIRSDYRLAASISDGEMHDAVELATKLMDKCDSK